MPIGDTMFHEPSHVPGDQEARFPVGSPPAEHGLLPETSVSLDMRGDQPNSRILLADGTVHHLGVLQVDPGGGGVAHWDTDHQRHDMGAERSDPSDPLDSGASMLLTRSLAGVGSTGPWLHDGRATTPDEAILAQCGEAAVRRAAYADLAEARKAEVGAFLASLVIDHPEPALPPPSDGACCRWSGTGAAACRGRAPVPEGRAPGGPGPGRGPATGSG